MKAWIACCCFFLLCLSLSSIFAHDIEDSDPSHSFNTFSVYYNHSDAHDRRRLTADIYKSLHESVTKDKLMSIVKKHSNYKNRLPFPHAIEDGIFPLDVMRAVAEEIPDSPELKSEGCAIGSQKCFKVKNEKYKNAFDDEEVLGPATAAFFGFLKSSTFIQFLEKLTGINDLIPDPHYRGSGIHQTLPGGYLGIHADFNLYKRYDLHRRVNILIYLNEDWQDEWGGHLELWSLDMKSCMVRARPDMGRLAVFSSTDFSYHGHPNPLKTPKDRSRRSLALYYYTKSRPASECIYGNCYAAHTTLFKTAPCRCEDKPCNKVLVNQK
jgi:hypothetical protein